MVAWTRDESLNQEKRVCSGYILKAESIEFVGALDLYCQEKRGINMITSRFWHQEKATLQKQERVQKEQVWDSGITFEHCESDTLKWRCQVDSWTCEVGSQERGLTWRHKFRNLST